MFLNDRVATGDSRQSFAVTVGGATTLGDLNPHRPQRDAWLVQYLAQTQERQSWGVQIHLLSTHVIAHESGFPFLNSEKVSVLGFLFAPTLCWNDSVSVCMGVGQGTVNANAKSARRDYGSWNYHLHASSHLAEQLSFRFQLSYVGKVEMVQNEQPSEFALAIWSLGLDHSL